MPATAWPTCWYTGGWPWAAIVVRSRSNGYEATVPAAPASAPLPNDTMPLSGCCRSVQQSWRRWPRRRLSQLIRYVQMYRHSVCIAVTSRGKREQVQGEREHAFWKEHAPIHEPCMQCEPRIGLTCTGWSAAALAQCLATAPAACRGRVGTVGGGCGAEPSRTMQCTTLC
eukprot:311633-Chlamydomonas_euryale.AAC.17